LDAVGQWHLPGTFVNDTWQNYITDPATGLPTFYGSINYRENDNLLGISGQNLGTFCWYYDKMDSGKVSMHANLHMPNGQYVSFAADGKFSVYRPNVSISSFHESTPTVYGNELNAAVQDDSFYYVALVTSSKDGYSRITQVFDDSSYEANYGTHTLDQSETYPDAWVTVHATAYNQILFKDNPGEQLTGIQTGLIITYTDYIGFQPSEPGSIVVTIGKVTWKVNAVANYVNGEWPIQPGSYVSFQAFDKDSVDFPYWIYVFVK
jgi:hypothetical protein